MRIAHICISHICISHIYISHIAHICISHIRISHICISHIYISHIYLSHISVFHIFVSQISNIVLSVGRLKPSIVSSQQSYVTDSPPDLSNKTGTAVSEATTHLLPGPAPGPGEELPNCGVREDCGLDGFSVQMYTGSDNREFPKICVSGK